MVRKEIGKIVELMNSGACYPCYSFFSFDVFVTFANLVLNHPDWFSGLLFVPLIFSTITNSNVYD